MDKLNHNQNYKNLLATISAVDFCKALGDLKAIHANNHTRTKKRAIERQLRAEDDLKKLGFELTIKPKI
jgi:hypothetical protein